MKRRGKASSKPDNKFKVKPQKKEDEYHSLKNELNFYLKPTVARTESATSNIQKQRISGKYMVIQNLMFLRHKLQTQRLGTYDEKISSKSECLCNKLAIEQKEKEDFKKRYEDTLKQYYTVIGVGDVQKKRQAYLNTEMADSDSDNEYYDIK